MWEMTQIFGNWLKCLRNDKRFKYVGNDVYIWKMAQVFEKRLNYVVNDFDLWEMTQICLEMA